MEQESELERLERLTLSVEVALNDVYALLREIRERLTAQ